MTIVTLVPSQASTADGGVKANGLPHSTSWSFAQTMLGGVVSTMVMVWLQKELLLQLSVAFQVRVAVNMPGQRGLAMLVVVPTRVMVTFVPSQISSADGARKSQVLPHSTIWLSAQVRLGGVVSTIVMVWLHDDLLLQLSVAIQVRVAVNSPGQCGL